MMIERSIVDWEGTRYGLAISAKGKQLLVEGDTAGFDGVVENGILTAERTPANAAALRARLPWLNPVALGRATSFGFGDRIGLATPGHVAALRSVGSRIAPIFAQQSVRENARIGRTPQEVMDDAMWGVFETGWRAPWGADADHMKEVAHVAPFVAAGYTFFTIDPSDHVDNDAQTDDLPTLRSKAAKLDWTALATTSAEMLAAYTAAPIVADDLTLTFDEETLLRALVKYGSAIVNTLRITAELRAQMGATPFDLEMSVDETDTPTSAEEHFFIANELIQRGVPVVSLAPRFVGKFQKGVDYMGDRALFEAELAKHSAVMRHFDCYKISVHTGSDKFSIYDTINAHAGGHVHVKTAGTSYLEALRVAASDRPSLFRKILDLGHERFAKDRKTYFLDCQPERVPTSDQLSDAELPDLLEQFDARQLLHVTFGSALDAYGEELLPFLASHSAEYEAVLVTHFRRHLLPFCQQEPV